jgi:hypothetical protein
VKRLVSSMRYLIAVSALCLVPGTLQSIQQPGPRVEIHGRVLYPNGEVAQGALIDAFKEGRLTGRIPIGNSDNEGRFIIRRLESGVQYDLCASKQDAGYLNPFTLPFGLSTGGKCKRITASPALEVDLVLAPKGGTLEGQARDARKRTPISNGKAIVYRPLKFLRGEWVLVNPREATWVPTAEAAVEGNGHFKISGLPTGTYFLKVEVPGRKPWYFNNQVSDVAAQPIVIQAGLTRKIVVSIP